MSRPSPRVPRHRRHPIEKRIPRQQRKGFTLIELGVVVLIIGILASFILAVSYEGIERAKERATQGTIAKLDAAVADYLAKILSKEVKANLAHRWLGAALLPPNSGNFSPDFQQITAVGANANVALPRATERAEVIARVDYVRSELPETFFVQVGSLPSPSSSGSNGAIYPLNFGAVPWLTTSPAHPFVASNTLAASSILPLGNGLLYNPAAYFQAQGGAPQTFASGGIAQIHPDMPIDPNYNAFGIGIFGATYTRAAGIYKNLGYLPGGYDGVDNNGNGWIDEWDEGLTDIASGTVDPLVVNPDNPSGASVRLSDLIQTRLFTKHRHVTARAEMLYAILVEGQDSVVTADAFSSNEIKDTDGDGLPEFVDGWGQPLLFFLWPTHYNSSLQKGINPQGYDGRDNDNITGADNPEESLVYLSASMNREQNTLDPGQQLVSPIWWSEMSDTSSSANYHLPSSKAIGFMQRYFSLLDPVGVPPSPRTITQFDAFGTIWDRSGYYKRREFLVRHLILSAGPNGMYGVPLMPDARVQTGQSAPAAFASDLILVENTAGQVEPNLVTSNANPYLLRSTPPSWSARTGTDPDPPWKTDELIDAGFDDFSSHNLKAPGTGLR